MSRLFISHASADNAAAAALHLWLCEQGFDDVFLDIDAEQGLVLGERWQEALKVAAHRCEAVLCLVSPAWLASKWCQAEFLTAKLLHKRIFALIVTPVPAEQIPADIATEWQLCELVGDDRFRTFEVEVLGRPERVAFREAGLDVLRRGLERAGLDARSFPWPPANEPGRAPYRGLKALEPQDAAVFFGRDAWIVRGLDRIRGLVEGGVERVLVILGASGSGKSSFLRAGLWPRLLRDDTNFLPLPVIRPQSAAIGGSSGLAVSLAGAFDRLGMARSPGHVRDMLAGHSNGLARLFGELSDLARQRLGLVNGQSEPVIVLPLDQAEELFNPDGKGEAERFLDLLGGVLAPAAGTSARRLLVVATMRSDRYELLQAAPQLFGIEQALFNLPPIRPEEFKSVIEGPAHRVREAGGRLDIDPALSEQLIADAVGADALPLLGFTLEHLYVDYGVGGRLTLAEYERLGGVQGSIEEAITGTLAEPGRAPSIPADKEAQLAALRAAFIPFLARIDADSGAPMRRVARRDEIPEGSRAFVARLVEVRLLVVDRRDGADVVEIAHESLLRQWPALAAWLDADRADLMLVEGVDRAAAEWQRNNRGEAWLDHRGERLAAAEALVARADFHRRLGDQGLAYLAACRTRDQAERREREAALAREQARLTEIAAVQARTARVQRVAAAALAAVLIVVGAGAGLVWWQRHVNAEHARALKAQQVGLLAGMAEIEQYHERTAGGLRLAIRAVRLGREMEDRSIPLAQANAELANALSRSGWRLMLSGHEGAVSSAGFSPDGRRIVTASSDKTARVWDAATGTALLVLRGHDNSVSSVAFSPDGLRIATASFDNTARVWDAATGQELLVLRGHENFLMSAAFSPDGLRIVTGSTDGTARVWDTTTGEEVLALRRHERAVPPAGLSPEGLRAAVLRTVPSVAFSPDGLRIVTGALDRMPRVWDAATGKELLTLRGREGSLSRAAFSPDGSRIVTASSDKTARVWDAMTGKELYALRGHEGGLTAAAFSPDGLRIVTASTDRTARVWDGATGEEVVELRGEEGAAPSAGLSPKGWQAAVQRTVSSVAFSPDGLRIATGSYDKTARVWNAATGQELLVLRGHENLVLSVCFSPDGLRIATASADKTARVWDAVTGAELHVLRRHEDGVVSAAFSPDGSRIATGSRDGTARVWDVMTGRERFVLRGQESAAPSAGLSAHGLPAALLRTVSSVAFSPDGLRIVTGSPDKTAWVWDASTGQEILTLRGQEGSLSPAAFSPDGSRIVTGSDDKTARVWDAVTGTELLVLRGHEGGVVSVAFSPDGSRIVTASHDNTVRLWDAATGREILALGEHSVSLPSARSARFSPDGSRIVTASTDMKARVWDVHFATMATDGLIFEACTRRLRGLSLLSRDEMRLIGEPDDEPPIDVCAGATT